MSVRPNVRSVNNYPSVQPIIVWPSIRPRYAYVGLIKEFILAIEAQWRAKNLALEIKSYLFEEIFVDDNCASLEIVHAKKY